MVSTHQCFTLTREHLSMFFFLHARSGFYNQVEFTLKGKARKRKKKKKYQRNVKITCIYLDVSRQSIGTIITYGL